MFGKYSTLSNHIKIYLPLFTCIIYFLDIIYHCFLFIIYLQLSTKIFRTIGTYWTTGSYVKSASGLTFVGKCKCPWLVHMICLTCCFSQWLQHFLSALYLFSNSNVLTVLVPCYFFPSFSWILKLSLD